MLLIEHLINVNEHLSIFSLQLYQTFGKGDVPEAMGRPRDWNIDLIPKFIMADG